MRLEKKQNRYCAYTLIFVVSAAIIYWPFWQGGIIEKQLEHVLQARLPVDSYHVRYTRHWLYSDLDIRVDGEKIQAMQGIARLFVTQKIGRLQARVFHGPWVRSSSVTQRWLPFYLQGTLYIDQLAVSHVIAYKHFFDDRFFATLRSASSQPVHVTPSTQLSQLSGDMIFRPNTHQWQAAFHLQQGSHALTASHGLQCHNISWQSKQHEQAYTSSITADQCTLRQLQIRNNGWQLNRLEINQKETIKNQRNYYTVTVNSPEIWFADKPYGQTRAEFNATGLARLPMITLLQATWHDMRHFNVSAIRSRFEDILAATPRFAFAFDGVTPDGQVTINSQLRIKSPTHSEQLWSYVAALSLINYLDASVTITVPTRWLDAWIMNFLAANVLSSQIQHAIIDGYNRIRRGQSVSQKGQTALLLQVNQGKIQLNKQSLLPLLIQLFIQ